MKLRVGAASDVGRVRQRNEDSYVAEDPLYAVADGLGGHQGGEVASAVALETLTGAATAQDGEGRIPDRLRESVLQANRAIHERAAGDSELAGMGTTLTALVAGTGRFHLAHVGDSRAYLLRENELSMLTEDHTLVRRLVQEGRLTEDEAGIHPQRSILTRALGIDDEIEVDQATVEIKPGDRLLLCSDGLTGMVSDEHIHQLLTGGEDPEAVATALVEAANAAGGQDNITVVVVDVLEAEEPPATIAAERGSPAMRAEGSRAQPAPARAPRRGRRALLWVLVLAVVLTLSLIGWRAYADRQWFVGVHEGNVALYHGVPVEVLGIDQFSLVEETLIDAEDVRRLQPWSELDDGITVGSEQEGRAIIQQIQQDVTAARPTT